MAIQAIVAITYCFVPDGASQMTVPSAQSIRVNFAQSGVNAVSSGTLLMPGGNTVNTANLSSLTANIAAAISSNLTGATMTQIAGWPTGGN